MKNGKAKRRIVIVMIIMALVAGVYGIKKITQPEAVQVDAAGMGPFGGDSKAKGASSVRVVPVVTQTTPVMLSALGTVRAANTAIVKPRVNGQLLRVYFQEGAYVRAGQVLAELDPKSFQIAASQAEGAVVSTQASLAQAQADLKRYEVLAQQESIAPQQLELQRSQVKQLIGNLKSNEASLSSARLNLQYSRITAPISGRVGLRQVDIGNQINTSDVNGLVTITQTQPVYVTFSLPEINLSDIWIPFQQGQRMLVEVWNRDNSQQLSTGYLHSIDNLVDVATGTFKLKAEFDNANNWLFPNQFVNIRITVKTIENALLIPTAALQVGSQGEFVWRLNKNNTVSLVPVKVGASVANQTIILDGLLAGQQVVTDGLDRLKEGARVRVVSATAQPAQATLTPAPKTSN